MPKLGRSVPLIGLLRTSLATVSKNTLAPIQTHTISALQGVRADAIASTSEGKKIMTQFQNQCLCLCANSTAHSGGNVSSSPPGILPAGSWELLICVDLVGAA
jgi:hypothetical protein